MERAGAVAESLSYAGALRAIGRFLDGENAARARVAEDPVALTVSWIGRDKQPHQRQYHKTGDLPTLIGQLRRQRLHRRDWENSWEERLRTIGQELDDEGIQLLDLIEAIGFKITGRADGEPVRRWYTWEDLARRSQERRRMRGIELSVLSPETRRPYEREGIELSAAIAVDPHGLTEDAATIAKTIVQPLLRLAGPSVSITIEITAALPPDVPADAVRTLEESCERLGFTLQRVAQAAPGA
jgi:hypothetical protein